MKFREKQVVRYNLQRRISSDYFLSAAVGYIFFYQIFFCRVFSIVVYL